MALELSSSLTQHQVKNGTPYHFMPITSSSFPSSIYQHNQVVMNEMECMLCTSSSSVECLVRGNIHRLLTKNDLILGVIIFNSAVAAVVVAVSFSWNFFIDWGGWWYTDIELTLMVVCGANCTQFNMMGIFSLMLCCCRFVYHIIAAAVVQIRAQCPLDSRQLCLWRWNSRGHCPDPRQTS